MIAVFIEIRRQGKILLSMCLCSGKMWKSNVKNIFSYNFPRWPAGVKSYHVVLKLLHNQYHLRPVNKKYFTYDVFSGMKSATTWNGNAVAQSPRKMSEFRDISNTSDIRFLMVYRTIIDVILHLFIICIDLWCQLLLFYKLSVITEALFSVRCLRCVVVARM